MCDNKTCDICIGIFNPLKHKIKTYRGFKIIIENPTNNFIGLRDRYRSAIVIKNRHGNSDIIIHLNFFGEIGYINQLPDNGGSITDYSPYLNLIQHEKVEKQKDVEQNRPLYYEM